MLHRLRILVVDDSMTLRSIVKRGIGKGLADTEVEEASSGRTARSVLQQRPFDLVICDWELPELTGNELLTWLRSHPVLGGMPFIILTSQPEKESMARAMEAGATAYLRKPVNMAELVRTISSTFKRLERRTHERLARTDDVTLEYTDHTLQGALVDISAGGILGTFPIGKALPSILEKVRLRIDCASGDPIPGIPGIVIRLQAVEASPDCEQVRVAVRFLEMPDDVRRRIAAFLATPQ